MIIEVDLESEFSNWSSHILQDLIEGEDCSPVFREIAIKEMALRGTCGMITLTSKLLHESSTNGSEGWNKKQLLCLGVPWPPKKGWLSALNGKKVPVSQWEKFLSLRTKTSPLTESAEGQHVQPSQQV